MCRHAARLVTLTMLILAALLLQVAPYPLHVAAEAPEQPYDLCREDGVCLAPPRLASQAASSSTPAALPQLQCKAAILVKREAGVEAASFSGVLAVAGFSQAEGLLVPQWWRVCANAPADLAGEMARIRRMQGVLAVEVDQRQTLTALPNDPYYPLQWSLPRVSAPTAWDTTMGSSPVMIAVVDTGLDYYHADAPADLWLSWDFGDSDNDPWDEDGHGTHVMGIAAARTNNGSGVAGACPGCSALTIKVIDADGLIWDSALTNGIAQAAYDGAYLSKRTVINVSIGGPYTQLKADAVNYARVLGALVVASAGNDGAGVPNYPAGLPGVLAVSATDTADVPTDFSQYGLIAAPGDALWSTVPRWYASPPYQPWSGTSMASPLVAGAAGLVWSRFPYYTADQVAQRLLSTVDIPAGWNALYGVGRLNVAAAVGPPLVLNHRVYLPLVAR